MILSTNDWIEIGIKLCALYGNIAIPYDLKIQYVSPDCDYWVYVDSEIKEYPIWIYDHAPWEPVPMKQVFVQLHRVNTRIKIGYVPAKAILLIQEKELL